MKDLESKMVEELQRIVYALRESILEQDYSTANFWSDRFSVCKDFVESVTKKRVEVHSWQVQLSDA